MFGRSVSLINCTRRRCAAFTFTTHWSQHRFRLTAGSALFTGCAPVRGWKVYQADVVLQQCRSRKPASLAARRQPAKSSGRSHWVYRSSPSGARAAMAEPEEDFRAPVGESPWRRPRKHQMGVTPLTTTCRTGSVSLLGGARSYRQDEVGKSFTDGQESLGEIVIRVANVTRAENKIRNDRCPALAGVQDPGSKFTRARMASSSPHHRPPQGRPSRSLAAGKISARLMYDHLPARTLCLF